MKCEVCNKKEATVHFTEIVGDKIVKLHLCEGCAQKKGIGLKSPFALTDFLSTLTDTELIGEEADRRCPHCGLRLKDFRKEGRLGCGDCYQTFEKALGSLIKTLHRGNHHTGKVPITRSSPRAATDLATLQRKLREAVKNEEFEKAAQLRDMIKKLKADED